MMSRRRRVLLTTVGGILFIAAFSLLFTLLSTAAVEQGQIVQQLSEVRAALERENAAMEEIIARESAIPRLVERARAMGFLPGEGAPALPLSLPAPRPTPGMRP
jgi:C4-dicarboxylate-specific signal transduction histidine kinase